MTAALPKGRGERRTRLYVLGDWSSPVYDSATSDMHPDDYLLTSSHTELGVVFDIPGVPGRPGTAFRWSEVWCQVSRRKIKRYQHVDLFKYLTWTENPLLPANSEIVPEALARR